MKIQVTYTNGVQRTVSAKRIASLVRGKEVAMIDGKPAATVRDKHGAIVVCPSLGRVWAVGY
jgi:hypothetical protein